MWFHPRPSVVPAAGPRASDDLWQARAAQADTRRRFLEVVEEGEQIRQVSSEMKIRRIRNGYEEMIEDAFARRPENL